MNPDIDYYELSDDDLPVAVAARITSPEKDMQSKGMMGGIIACVGLLLLLIGLLLFMRRRRKQKAENVAVKVSPSLPEPKHDVKTLDHGINIISNPQEHRISNIYVDPPEVGLKSAPPHLYSEPVNVRSDVQIVDRHAGGDNQGRSVTLMVSRPKRSSNLYVEHDPVSTPPARGGETGGATLLAANMERNVTAADQFHDGYQCTESNVAYENAGGDGQNVDVDYLPMNGGRVGEEQRACDGYSAPLPGCYVMSDCEPPPPPPERHMHYDVPRPEHIYSEIATTPMPCSATTTAENIYESLDDVQGRIKDSQA